MKTKSIYILMFLVAAALVVLFVTGMPKKRRLDERITLRKKDKIPYGTYVSYRSLPYLFPHATVYTSRHEPGYWDSVSVEDPKQAFIAITDYFNADEFELRKLISFAENGNDVFVSARDISYDAAQMITSGGKNKSLLRYTGSVRYELDDSLEITLLDPEYATFSYPGKFFSSFFTEINESTTDILGKDEDGHPNFIHLRAGKGNFYLQLAPLAFSNYFLLHKNNIAYYETALSVISPGVTKIIWDEYYLTKRSDRNPPLKKKSWLTILFRYPSFRAGLLTAMLALLAYVILEMRRKQRYIPLVTRPRNDSLDFVKTIGRLYYEKGDHKNLARKMAAYFLEHVRSQFKLPTGTLDEQFTRSLQYKSGVEESEIRNIVSFINYIDDAPVISAKELTGFHKQLEWFYKKA